MEFEFSYTNDKLYFRILDETHWTKVILTVKIIFCESSNDGMLNRVLRFHFPLHMLQKYRESEMWKLWESHSWVILMTLRGNTLRHTRRQKCVYFSITFQNGYWPKITCLKLKNSYNNEIIELLKYYDI